MHKNASNFNVEFEDISPAEDRKHKRTLVWFSLLCFHRKDIYLLALARRSPWYISILYQIPGPDLKMHFTSLVQVSFWLHCRAPRVPQHSSSSNCNRSGESKRRELVVGCRGRCHCRWHLPETNVGLTAVSVCPVMLEACLFMLCFLAVVSRKGGQLSSILDIQDKPSDAAPRDKD